MVVEILLGSSRRRVKSQNSFRGKNDKSLYWVCAFLLNIVIQGRSTSNDSRMEWGYIL